ncbi:hypothetical protein Tco_0963524, partial [Tanacetum coccineum]
LDNEDLEQINADDLEEMDLKWKLDLNGKETVGFDRNRDDPRRNALVDTSTTNALVVQDGIGGYDWSFQAEEGITNFALMAYTSQGLSSSSISDSEVHTCSKDCLKSYEALQKQYDQQCEALNKSNLEITSYRMGLESLEARIVVYEKNEVVYEEDIAFLKYDVQVIDISIKELKNQLENALKEKDDLKLKLEKFETSTKNLTNLINSQMSAKDKIGLGYDGQMNEIPPPYTGNYMPPRANLSFAGLDDSVFKVNNVTTAGPKAVVSAAEGNGENVVKSSACWIWRPTGNVIDHTSKDSGSYMLKRFDYGNPQYTLQDQGIFDSGCSRHMTGNKSFLTDYQEIDGGFVAFGGSPKGGKITGKGKIRTGKLDFEDVYFVKELKFNLFSVSQMCDKKNNVLFTKTECLVLSPDFKGYWMKVNLYYSSQQ